MRKIIVTIGDRGDTKVVFVGEHLIKIEFLRAVKAIKLEYRRRIRMYRHAAMAERSKIAVASAKKETENKNLGDGKNVEDTTAK